MYKLMIADDEPIERQAFRLLVQKHFPEVEILPDAAAGNEVVVKVRQNKPDILFLDVQMPMMSGIEALYELSDMVGRMKVIILSAHEKFEFAQKALKYGANEYLLKPVRREEMIRIISNYITKMDEERRTMNWQVNINERINLISPHIEHEIITHIVNGDRELNEMKDFFQTIDISMEDFVIIGVKCALPGKDFVKQVIQAAKEISTCIASGVSPEYALIILPVGGDATESEQTEWINGFVKYIFDKAKEKQMAVSIGVSNPYRETKYLRSCYRQVMAALEAGHGNICFYKTISQHANECWKDYCNKELLAYVFNTAETDMEKNINGYFYGMLVSEKRTHAQIRQTVVSLLEEMNDRISDQAQKYQNYLVIKKIGGCENITLVKSLLKEYLVQFHKKLAMDTKQLNFALLNATEYIKKNYYNDISLSDIAAHANVSTFYLSKLFKQCLDINYTDYLTEVRVEKAKELLITSTMSIKEITYEIGYNNPAYFCQVFKKIEGRSASQFRKEHIYIE